MIGRIQKKNRFAYISEVAEKLSISQANVRQCLHHWKKANNQQSAVEFCYPSDSERVGCTKAFTLSNDVESKLRDLREEIDTVLS